MRLSRRTTHCRRHLLMRNKPRFIAQAQSAKRSVTRRRQ
ncbi:hypothetical protein LG3211_2160 [Lysobacter gummosus]|nr:hypothetical protein LG3211_2160 [Lysobacter gummosus]